MKVMFSTLLFALGALNGVAAMGENYTYMECPTHADPQDCPVPDYTPCAEGELQCGTKERHNLTAEEEGAEQRRLQIPLPMSNQFTFSDSTNLPYDKPCFGPSRDTLRSSWTKWEAADDAAVNVPISFPFDFYGETYNDVMVVDNGFISFKNTFRNNYQPTSFPSGLGVPMIAPFWADVETAHNGGRGDIYYRDFGELFAVIWDEVGYYKDGNVTTPTHNSFQVVISKTTNQRLPDLSNICFCYLDMGWSHGDRDGEDGFGIFSDITSGIRSATVGITKGLDDPFGTTTYAQIGRFNETGNTHRGVALNSGVDWLDWLGSNGPQQVNQRTGFCFNGAPNLPPILKAFPMNGTITIPCNGQLDEYKAYFGTPEMEQTLNLLSVSGPSPEPNGLQLTFDGGGFASDTLGIRFEWLDVNFAEYGGQTFEYTFEVCDDHAQNPLCITATVSIVVGTCGEGNTCLPDKCTPITDSTCAAGENQAQPVCTPWRSPEHCDPLFSFPTLVSSRYPLIKDSLRGPTDFLGDDDWWFHYTDDRAGAYSFTSFHNEPAPKLLCCVTSVVDLLGVANDPSTSACFDGMPAWGDAFVIRAEGHHSGQGVFVLPTGLDNVGGSSSVELNGGLPVTIEQIRGYLDNLVPAPKKFVVEEFIAGSGSGATATLPDEYKFHMFNGKIGSISAFKNRNTPCSCYGEYSEDWECLHTNGCFLPSLPMGLTLESDPSCYMVDMGIGQQNPFPIKGFDLCGPTPPPEACLFDRMKEIAVKLSTAIGVYARIDMFVTDNNMVYVQEYTFNHLGGTRHCASRVTDSGCIDSCILGKCWQDAGGDPDMGGPKFPPPAIFGSGYGGFTDSQQCFIALGQTATFSGDACGSPTEAPTTLAPSSAPVIGAGVGAGQTAPPRPDFTSFPSKSP